MLLMNLSAWQVIELDKSVLLKRQLIGFYQETLTEILIMWSESQSNLVPVLPKSVAYKS